MLKPDTEVLIYPSAQEVAEAGALRLVELGEVNSGRKLKPRVALAGGSTPKAMYEVLRRCTGADAAALRRVRYFFGDERAVPNDHADSNVLLAMEGFLNAMGVPLEQIYPPNGAAAVLSAEAWRLSLLLDRTLPKSPDGAPQFDLVYLGMGTDGHTASLFPGTEALEATDKGYVSNEVPQLGTNRLTLTYPVLNAAKHLLLMVTGDNKATVLREIFSRGKSARVYPIEFLEGPRITWMLDLSAAALLPQELLRLSRPQ